MSNSIRIAGFLTFAYGAYYSWQRYQRSMIPKPTPTNTVEKAHLPRDGYIESPGRR